MQDAVQRICRALFESVALWVEGAYSADAQLCLATMLPAPNDLL